MKPYVHWTIPELERARILVVEIGIPASAASKILTYEFGHIRSGASVARALHKYCDWHGKQRGPGVQFNMKKATVNVD